MYKRRRKSKPKRPRSANDCHHIFFTRRRWGGPLFVALREHWYTRAIIPKDSLHKEIHSEISYVPVPRALSVRFALNQLDLLEKYNAIHDDDSFEKKLQVLIAIFEYVEEPTAEALKRQQEIVRYNKKPS